MADVVVEKFRRFFPDVTAVGIILNFPTLVIVLHVDNDDDYDDDVMRCL
jgi:hypothetical protein